MQAFLGNFTSYSTRHNYQSQLVKYFKFIDKDPDTYIQDVRLLENGDKIRQLNIYELDLNRYWQKLKEEKAPKSIVSILAIIKSFLLEYHIELEKQFWNKLKRRGNGDARVINDIEVTHKMVEKILQYADVKERAFILAQASSGMRISELCSLSLKDVDFKSGKRPRVLVRYNKAKNRNPRITFFSAEATESIKAWIEIRDSYLEYVSKICNLRRTLPNGEVLRPTKSREDGRLFPFEANSARQNILIPLLKKAGLDEKDDTGRYRFHSHSLRQFFRKNAMYSKKGIDLAEQLMGHKGYIDQYREIKETDLLEKYYIETEKNLQIFTRPPTEDEIEKRARKLMEERMADLESRVLTKIKNQLNTPGEIKFDYND